MDPVKGKVVIESDTSGVDKAKSSLNSFGEVFGTIGTIAAGIGLEKVVEDIVNLGKTATQFAIQAGTNFEQWRISFETMLGSADKASKLMQQISDFAVKTPFELPQLVEGAKQLVAFGVASQDVVGKLQELGDIAAGVGTDKLPLLIHAYGQIQAGQKLTGRELNEFVMSGVPLLQALVDHYNKAGVAATGMSSHIEKGTKMSAAAMTSLQHNVEETQARLKILGEEHVKSGIATDRHNLSVLTATHNLEEYQSKISGANKVVTSFGGAHKVTAENVRDMISANRVSAKDIDAALAEMTGKGGRFFDMMEKQSHTFGGIMSNIRDQFTRTALHIIGFSDSGDLAKGSVFDRLKAGAQQFLDFINTHQKDIEGFAQKAIDMLIKLSDIIIKQVVPVLMNMYHWVEQNRWILTIVAGVIVGVLAAGLGALIVTVGTFVAGVIALIGTIGALVAVIVGAVAAAFTDFMLHLHDTGDAWKALEQTAVDVLNVILGAFNTFINSFLFGINLIIGAINSIAKTKIPTLGVNFQIPQLSNPKAPVYGPPAPAFASGNIGGNAYGPPAPSKTVNVYNTNTFNTRYDPNNFANYQASLINP